MTTMTDLTDRDRLAAAFDELRQTGWIAPIDWAWEQCCGTCAFHDADNLDPTAPVIFWHVQKDDAAFFNDPYGADTFPEEIDDDQDITPERHAAELAWRLAHATLVRDLWLHWRGTHAQAAFAIRNLRSHGLDATWDGDPGDCIRIRPPARPEGNQ